VNGTLDIYNNPSLTDLSGLSSLTQVIGDLSIYQQSVSYINLKNIIFVGGTINLNETNLICYNLSTYLIKMENAIMYHISPITQLQSITQMQIIS